MVVRTSALLFRYGFNYTLAIVSNGNIVPNYLFMLIYKKFSASCNLAQLPARLFEHCVLVRTFFVQKTNTALILTVMTEQELSSHWSVVSK